MAKKTTNLTAFQEAHVDKRASFIEQAIAVTDGTQYPSYNAYTVFLAKLLTQYEQMEAKREYEAKGSVGEFIPPKPASRQIFVRNKAYSKLAKAAYAGKKVEGSLAIQKPKTPSEFKAVLIQRDFEISNLKAEIDRLNERAKHTNEGQLLDTETADTSELEMKLRQEKSKSIQAIINILRWADGLLEFRDGQVIDLAARGGKAEIVEKQLLKHSADTISRALKGFS